MSRVGLREVQKFLQLYPQRSRFLLYNCALRSLPGLPVTSQLSKLITQFQIGTSCLEKLVHDQEPCNPVFTKKKIRLYLIIILFTNSAKNQTNKKLNVIRPVWLRHHCLLQQTKRLEVTFPFQTCSQGCGGGNAVV